MTRPRRSLAAFEAEADQLAAWQRDDHGKTTAGMLRALSTPLGEGVEAAGFFDSDLADGATGEDDAASADPGEVEWVVVVVSMSPAPVAC